MNANDSAKKIERERLVAEIYEREIRTQAESDFDALFGDERNPWSGSAADLAVANDRLAKLDEDIRLGAFRELIQRYRQSCDTLRAAMANQDRLREIESEKKQCADGYKAMMQGALHRRGDPTSERDAEEREAAAKWRALEDESTRLSSVIGNARENRASMEREDPFLTSLGAQLDELAVRSKEKASAA